MLICVSVYFLKKSQPNLPVHPAQIRPGSVLDFFAGTNL